MICIPELIVAFEHIDSAPKLFNEAGYLTGILGKVHVGPDHVYPWEWRLESESRDVQWVAEQAAGFFDRAEEEERPFFLTVGYVDPHRDVTTRGGFGNQETYGSRVKPLRCDPKTVEVPSWLSDLPETRQELAEYYEAINRTDQGIGFVLEELERRGLSDNTLIIVTSDNGPPFMNAKTTLYDAGTCLPFIVRTPAGEQGIVNPNMISWVDVLPTLMDYAGIASKETSEEGRVSPGAGMLSSTVVPSPPRGGRSFLPFINRQDVVPESEWQHHIFGSHTFHELQNYWPTRVCRTRRYKYHRNIAWKLDFPFASDLYASYSFQGMREAAEPAMMGQRSFDAYIHRPAEELFDLETDPDEIDNLASSPDHQDVLLVMRRKVEKWQLETRDLWLYRDGHSVVKMLRYAADGLSAPDRFDMESTLRGAEIKTPSQFVL